MIVGKSRLWCAIFNVLALGLLGCDSDPAVPVPAEKDVEVIVVPQAAAPDAPEPPAEYAPPTEGNPQISPTPPAPEKGAVDAPMADGTALPTEGAPAGEATTQ